MAPGVMWTKEDCEKLNELVEKHGKKWTPIAQQLAGGKTGKQCRRQWERLNTPTKQCSWTKEEDALLMKFHSKYGNKWTRISKLIGGRTDNAVKNRYHALCLKKKAKYLSRFDSGDTTSSSIRGGFNKCSSLEEYRIAKGQVDRVKMEEIPFKSEAMHQTGLCDGNWTDGQYQVERHYYDPQAYVTADLAVQTIMAPTEDADSIESTSEDKMFAPVSNQSECFSNIYEGNLVSPFYNCQAFSPLQQRPIEPSFNNRRQELTLDLSFQQGHEGIDFDSLLNSLSPPLSTKQYWNYLCSLSPVDLQPSFVSDHDARMNA